METDNRKYEGTCFCGKVKIQVKGTAAAAGYCHCHSCRKWHGAPINAWTIWPDDAVEITQGQDLIHTFNMQGKDGPSTRLSCKTCGAAVANQKPQSSMTVVYAMTLAESDYSFEPALHIWYAERVLDIADTLPKFVDLPIEYGGSGDLIDEPATTGLRS